MTQSSAENRTTMSASSIRVVDVFTLLEWKRKIFALYDEVRSTEPRTGWQRWREVRDEMFRHHPQSPLPVEARATFRGLDYFPYDELWRVTAGIVPVTREQVPIGASGGETIHFERFAQARFALGGDPVALDLFWLEGYGGGLFLPFSDGTSASETYPAGRYLLDTVKGADLGTMGDHLVLDFNFAYNPSCAYDPRWVCPLAPTANRLDISVWAGERRPKA
jgi:uncharacterized protein (DUF1684 family)